jgi:glyoxylase I family protein
MEPVGPVHHISFTVRDLDASVAWYSDLFELRTMMDEEHDGGRAVVLVQPETHAFIGLHAHRTTPDAAFAETTVGLDHVAFGVPDRAALQTWQQRLAERAVPHSEIKDRGYGSVLTLRDPDNIQIELYAPPSA